MQLTTKICAIFSFLCCNIFFVLWCVLFLGDRHVNIILEGNQRLHEVSFASLEKLSMGIVIQNNNRGDLPNDPSGYLTLDFPSLQFINEDFSTRIIDGEVAYGNFIVTRNEGLASLNFPALEFLPELSVTWNNCGTAAGGMNYCPRGTNPKTAHESYSAHGIPRDSFAFVANFNALQEVPFGPFFHYNPALTEINFNSLERTSTSNQGSATLQYNPNLQTVRMPNFQEAMRPFAMYGAPNLQTFDVPHNAIFHTNCAFDSYTDVDTPDANNQCSITNA